MDAAEDIISSLSLMFDIKKKSPGRAKVELISRVERKARNVPKHFISKSRILTNALRVPLLGRGMQQVRLACRCVGIAIRL